MEIIESGAEAIISGDATLIRKDRVKKSYRHPQIDKALRQARTRREAKILEELKKANFPAPRLMMVDDKSMVIDMQRIDGQKLRDIFDKDHVAFSQEIGAKLARLHSLGIIHADLTTSNMIHNNQIYFIDFGLSFFSTELEDKAVDLHLLNRALESKHPSVHKESFDAVQRAYLAQDPVNQSVLDRLKVVERRGRYKNKGS
ncbi:Kae1-associated serine/threonine protein kinase [Candidatus Woesearchaeota archaeon]|nr:Kae1-associated serine/threonine protein kinase [Candidatus Woesearchaeota archaeon]